MKNYSIFFLTALVLGSFMICADSFGAVVDFGGGPKELECLIIELSHPDLLYARAEGPVLTNPDWVPPVNREKYPGYQIHEDARKNSQSWKYSTNRPGGKIKGGGTVKYLDYRSVTTQTRPGSGGSAKKK